jgi:hypothetical protein
MLTLVQLLLLSHLKTDKTRINNFSSSTHTMYLIYLEMGLKSKLAGLPVGSRLSLTPLSRVFACSSGAPECGLF